MESSRGVPVNSATLAGGFGLSGRCGQRVTKALYETLSQLPSHVQEEILNHWQGKTGYLLQPGARGRERERRALEQLAQAVGIEGTSQGPLLLMAVTDYYEILIRTLATPILGGAVSLPSSDATADQLYHWLVKVAEHPFYSCSDELCIPWYLEHWQPKLAADLAVVVGQMSTYNWDRKMWQPGAADCLQHLYQSLLPSTLRHGLGEFYTPGWLVELVVGLVEPEVNPANSSVLDPTCGSGAFLLGSLAKLRQVAREQGWSREQLQWVAVNQVVGVDKNPLAVQAARVNYLLAGADLLPEGFVPAIFQGDLLLAPPREVADREFQRVVGNPPWLNWETMDVDYRAETVALWADYGLFHQRGYGALLGKSKDDLATLITYVTCHRYLAKTGTLAFILPQSLLKTTGAGQGFRTFTLPDGEPLGVVEVHDFSAIKPFSGVNNRTAVVVLTKGQKTAYPVPYVVWDKGQGTRNPDPEATLAQVVTRTNQVQMAATPVPGGQATAPWITAHPSSFRALEKVMGPSFYRAREGVNTGGANGVYYLNLMETSGHLVKARNLTQGAKRPVPQIEVWLEGQLIYPLLRGRDIKKWQAIPKAWLLLPHRPGEKLKAISASELEISYPCCHQYFHDFAAILCQRRTKVVRDLMAKGPVYSLFGVGDYTFAPFKVAWLRIGTRLKAAVVSEIFSPPGLQPLVIPNDSIVFVPFADRTEADFFCALINSAPAQVVICSTSVMSTGSFASPHILEKVAIPQFDGNDPLHRELAELAQGAAEAAARGETTSHWEEKIDWAAGRLWGLTNGEVGEMRDNLAKLPR